MASEDVVIGGRAVRASEWVMGSHLNTNRDPELVAGDPGVLASLAGRPRP